MKLEIFLRKGKREGNFRMSFKPKIDQKTYQKQDVTEGSKEHLARFASRAYNNIILASRRIVSVEIRNEDLEKEIYEPMRSYLLSNLRASRRSLN